MQKLIYVTLAVAEDFPTALAEREVATKVLVGDRARVIDVSDEARVETVAQIVTAFGELRRHMANLLRSLDRIQSDISDMTFAFDRLGEGVKVLHPPRTN